MDFTASLQDTITTSWQAAVTRFQAAIASWQQRQVPTLRVRCNILETFLFSKLYYLAQALPLPAAAARAITASAGAFLWGEAGFGAKRVAWETLHNPYSAGGLAVTHIHSRAEALLVKQSCWMAGQNDRAAAHMAFWHGDKLEHLYPQLHPPQLPRRLPSFMPMVTALLEEVAVTGLVDTAALSAVTAKEIYVFFMSSPPPPGIESKQQNINWTLACKF